MQHDPLFDEGDDVVVLRGDSVRVAGIIQKVRPDGMTGWLYDVEISNDRQTTTLPEVHEAQLREPTAVTEEAA